MPTLMQPRQRAAPHNAALHVGSSQKIVAAKVLAYSSIMRSIRVSNQQQNAVLWIENGETSF
jgi:hypothetical protein